MEFYEINPEYSGRLMLLDDQGRRFTYGDFGEFCEKAGRKLKPGSLMALFCENSIGSVVLYLTCLNRGVVPLLLDKSMDRALAEQLIETYQPEYIAMPADMERIRGGLKAVPVVAELRYMVYETGAASGDAAACAGNAASAQTWDSRESGMLHKDLALLLTTSGSTGSPKLVRQSRKNIVSNARSIAEYLELDASERPITSLPMHYTYGLSIINSHLTVGAAVLLTGRTLFEREFWDFFRDAGATSISGVPYTYEMLKRLSFLEMELPTLRTMTQAGGKLSVKLHREFAEYAAKTNRKFIVMYGQTEATARMGYLPARYAIEKCGSMGIAIPGGRFRLMEDEHTEITEPDVTGELVYEGDNVTMGYAWCREDLKKGDERGGILFTGDMAKRDKDGFYYITGRKKRFLKLYGKRVNMDEIEQLLKGQYDGVDVACTGEDDHMRIYLAGLRAETCQETCREAGEWITGKTGLHPRGVEVLPIDEIPKNGAGKTIYKDLP